MHSFDFIIGIYHEAQSFECQIQILQKMKRISQTQFY